MVTSEVANIFVLKTPGGGYDILNIHISLANTLETLIFYWDNYSKHHFDGYTTFHGYNWCTTLWSVDKYGTGSDLSDIATLSTAELSDSTLHTDILVLQISDNIFT
jgi:hypothetical protein